MFSIIIPTYNSAEKLKKAINSVLDQTFSEYEVLIMDDGSTDDTAEIIESIQDSRVIYEWEENSGGPANPRNRGIQKAKYEWVCFLDADDWWTPNKLEVCVKYINDKVDFIYHDLFMIDGNNKVGKPIKSRILKYPILKNLLINGNCISNSSVLVRKELLKKVKGINETKEMIAAEDYNTWLKIATITDNFLYVKENLGYYLEDNTGISSKKNMANPNLEASKEFFTNLTPRELIKANTITNYIQARYQYLEGNYVGIHAKLWSCLCCGSFELKVKSFYMLIGMLTKKKTIS